MSADKFDFIGSDGGYLDPDGDARIVVHRATWKAGVARGKLERAVKQFADLVQASIWPVLQEAVEKVAQTFTKFATTLKLPDLGRLDPKAAERARSKADVRSKRREMMKLKGRR